MEKNISCHIVKPARGLLFFRNQIVHFYHLDPLMFGIWGMAMWALKKGTDSPVHCGFKTFSFITSVLNKV